MTLHQLPSFADLMLLPPTIDRHAKVSMRGGRITIRTQSPDAMQQLLTPYPHTDAVVQDDQTVVVQPKAAHYRNMLMLWPSGRRLGVCLWEGGYYSTVASSTMLDLISAGVHVELHTCIEDHTFENELERIANCTCAS